MDPRFEYDPLDLEGMSTRIIKLKPAINSNAALHCEIITMDLNGNDRHAYEAVSYTWNGQIPSPEHLVFCHSKDNTTKILCITENSKAALQRMRLEQEDRYLWMDSISINQKCLRERNHQVALMGYVYTLAKRVLIWLGEKVTRDTWLTLDYIKRIAAYDSSNLDSQSQLQSIFEEIRKGDE